MLIDGRQRERRSLQETTGESLSNGHGFRFMVIDSMEKWRSIDKTGVHHLGPFTVQFDLKEIFVKDEINVVPFIIGQIESRLCGEIVRFGRQTQTQSSALIGRQQRHRQPIAAHDLLLLIHQRSYIYSVLYSCVVQLNRKTKPTI